MRSVDGLTYETVEQQSASAGRASIEAEGEFVQVVRQVLLGDRALMGSQEPAFEEGGDAVYGRECNHRLLRGCTGHSDAVAKSLRCDAGVALPTIGMDETAGLHGRGDESLKGRAIHIQNVSQANPSDLPVIHLDGDDDNGSLDGLAAQYARSLGANVRFVDINLPGQLIPIGSDHRSAKLLQPCPGGLVAPQPESSLDAKGARTVFVAGDLPGRKKPRMKLTTALENRARRGGHLAVACRAHEEASRRPPRFGGRVPLRANESVAPPQTLQVRHACCVVREEPPEFDEGPRIVDSRLGLPELKIGHDHMIQWLEE